MEKTAESAVAIIAAMEAAGGYSFAPTSSESGCGGCPTQERWLTGDHKSDAYDASNKMIETVVYKNAKTDAGWAAVARRTYEWTVR